MVFVPGPISTTEQLRLISPVEVKVSMAADEASMGEIDVFQKQLTHLVLIFPLSRTILVPSFQLINSFNLFIHLGRSPVLLRLILVWVGERLLGDRELLILKSKGSIFSFLASISKILSIQKVRAV